MKAKTNLIFLAALSLFGTRAMADMICTESTIVNNQALPCISVQIPDDAGISSQLTCNGHKFTVDCDLHSNPNKLSLSIVGPEGSVSSTNPEIYGLDLVDKNGNGASIKCVAQ